MWIKKKISKFLRDCDNMTEPSAVNFRMQGDDR